MMADMVASTDDDHMPVQVVLGFNWFEELKARVPVP